MTSPAPQLLSDVQLAKAMKVSDRMVRKWLPKGLPSVMVGRLRRYDLAAVKKWAAENIQHVKGGPRGGGRPKKPKATDEAPPPLVLAEQPTIPARLANGEFGGLKDSADILKRMEDGKATPVWAHTLQQVVKAAQAMDELNTAAAKLVDAEDVRQTWASTLQMLRVFLDNLASKLTKEVSAKVPMDRPTETAFRKAINESVLRVLGDLERGKA